MSFPPILETFSEHYKYWEYSIGYTGIQLSGLPASIAANGELLAKKDEFHITAVNVKALAGLVDGTDTERIMAEIVEDFKNFIKTKPLDEFRLTDQLRFVQRGEEKTVVVLCDLPGAEDFFNELREKYKKPLPTQPFHITLYMVNSKFGIGILSDEILDKISEPIELPELKNLKPA